VTDTRGRIPSDLHTTPVILTQFVSPDDEHDVLETCRDLKYK